MQTTFKSGLLISGDCLSELKSIKDKSVNLVVADPPYFQVLLGEKWDNEWESAEAYINWCVEWVRECKRVLTDDGLMYIFGQHGKREHTWIHLCSRLSNELQFHDLIIWDRAVGYNERGDSFTPQYEMILSLRKSAESKPFFNKDAVRTPYDEETISEYLKDKRYKDREAREAHLRKGKYATNILRVPSLKGTTKEKVGHPSQKPIELISMLIRSSSPEGGLVLDPFLGSGTTAIAAALHGRKWLGIEKSSEYFKMIKKRVEDFESDNALIMEK